MQLSFGQVAALLQGCLHSVRHSMHDLAWRTQKSLESQQAVNEALLKHLQAIAPPRAPPAARQAAPPAAPPRQPQHPPPAEMLRKAPETPPATPQPKLQPRITNTVNPPLQNPSRTRTPPPAVTRPTTPTAANSQQATAAPVKGQRLLCPKPQTGAPAAKAQPRTAGPPKKDCHLRCFLVVIQQSCSLHCL